MTFPIDLWCKWSKVYKQILSQSDHCDSHFENDQKPESLRLFNQI